MRMPRARSLLVLLGGFLVGACAMAPKSVSSPPNTAVLWPASQIRWAADPVQAGLQRAALTGSSATGAYRELARFDAGLSVPLHHHTSEIRAFVHSGTMIWTMEGRDPVEVGPGSWVILPGGERHTTACKSGEDCVVYVEQPGRFDLILAR